MLAWFNGDASSSTTSHDDQNDTLPIPRRYYPTPSDTVHEPEESDTESDCMETSALFVGLWECADQERLGTTPTQSTQIASLVKHVEAGITTLDAADHYGHSETLISEFLQVHGESYICEICTKFCPKPGPMTFPLVEAAIARSRGRLFPDEMEEAGKIIDVLHFHWWSWHGRVYIRSFKVG